MGTGEIVLGFFHHRRGVTAQQRVRPERLRAARRRVAPGGGRGCLYAGNVKSERASAARRSSTTPPALLDRPSLPLVSSSTDAKAHDRRAFEIASAQRMRTGGRSPSQRVGRQACGVRLAGRRGLRWAGWLRVGIASAET